MDQRPALTEALERARTSMLAGLEEIDRNRKIYPLWTIREILAHLSGWDDSVLAFIQALQAGTVPPATAVRGVDVYNAETVSTREGLDYDHIYREYLETRRQVLSQLRALPAEKVTEVLVLPWGAPGSLANLISVFAAHEAEHAQDVQKLIATAQEAAASPTPAEKT